MTEWLEWLSRAPVVKWIVIIGFAMLSAAMQRDMSLVGRMLTLVAGVAAAVVFADPFVQFFDLSATYANAVAAVLAMTGRNWAAFAIRASRDPIKTLAEVKAVWWGKK
ncbi:MAG: hypothetical protein ABJL55_16215 [Roseibium sp.]